MIDICLQSDHHKHYYIILPLDIAIMCAADSENFVNNTQYHVYCYLYLSSQYCVFKYIKNVFHICCLWCSQRFATYLSAIVVLFFPNFLIRKRKLRSRFLV